MQVQLTGRRVGYEKLFQDWQMRSRIAAAYGHMCTIVCIARSVWLLNRGLMGLSDIIAAANHHKDWLEYEHKPTLMQYIINYVAAGLLCAGHVVVNNNS